MIKHSLRQLTTKIDLGISTYQSIGHIVTLYVDNDMFCVFFYIAGDESEEFPIVVVPAVVGLFSQVPGGEGTVR